MALIEWNDKLSVGIPSIDMQHKKLIQMINDLHQAMAQGKGNEALGKVFGELIQYTKQHFANEERYFAQFSYSKTASHKKEHTDLTDKVIHLQKEFESGKLGISMPTMEFLKTWLVNHIGKCDQAYAPFLIEKGVR